MSSNVTVILKPGGIMEKNIKGKNKVEDKGNGEQKAGFFKRFLKWISKGTEKATRNGSFCNT